MVSIRLTVLNTKGKKKFISMVIKKKPTPKQKNPNQQRKKLKQNIKTNKKPNQN